MHIEYEPIDSEPTALGTLSLHAYRAETGERGYEIRIDGEFLMASHGAAGEKAMARLAYERLPRPVTGLGAHTGLCVLVGGLGAGHTLRAVLDLPGVERVVVAELGAKVVQWNRRYFAEVNGHALDDARVELEVGDLAALLSRWPQRFDLVLLDVDNGPGWLAASGNAGLYQPAGVLACRATLRPQGVLAVWSPEPNPAFREILGRVLTDVEEILMVSPARGEGGLPDVVYLGR